MPFEQGQSGNPGGRPKGSMNQAKRELKEAIAQFLLNNFEKVQAEFEQLQGKDKVQFYCALLPYGLAKVKPEAENLLDGLSDEQVLELFEKLQHVVNTQIENTLSKAGLPARPAEGQTEDS
jgi:hypothetical protein